MVARSPRLCKMLAISHLFSQAVYPFDVFQDCWGGQDRERPTQNTPQMKTHHDS